MLLKKTQIRHLLHCRCKLIENSDLISMLSYDWV